MADKQKQTITVQTTINAPVDKVWEAFTNPEDITKWYFASDDWHAPHAENDLRVDGTFKTTMAAKDGSAGFDFGGTYSAIEQHRLIEYYLGDGRTVKVEFSSDAHGTTVKEMFDTEDINSAEMQRAGWQSILDNFKKHVEQK